MREKPCLSKEVLKFNELITICLNRFGSGIRTEKADAKVPGAGTYHPNLIEVPVKPHRDMPKSQRFKLGANQIASGPWPGPAAYRLPEPKGAAQYSLGARFDEKRVPMFKKEDGSRFDSAIRAKPHLRPKKVDGPGPGDYIMPSSIKQKPRHARSTQGSTFGGGSRDWSDLPQNTPGPTAYSQLYPKPPEQRAFSNDGYSFPKEGEKGGHGGFLKISANPGPGNYNPQLQKSGTSKPMLGGKTDPLRDKDSGVPGPGKYDPAN